MIVAVCTIELEIPMAASLKDKRRVIRSLTARLRKEFNISVAEVGRQNVWQAAIIGVATVSSDRDYAHRLLTRVVGWIERSRLDCQLIDYDIELI